MGDNIELFLDQKQIQQLNITITPALRQAIELLQFSTMELHDYLKNQALENPLIELEEKDSSPFQQERTFQRTRNRKQEADRFHWIADKTMNLRDELIQQARWHFTDAQEIELAIFLIQNLDDNGYLHLPDEQTLTESTLTAGIHLLQQIGPPGLGARTLQECLSLQLQDQPNNEQALQLINDYFHLLSQRKWNDIAKKMKISLDAVKVIFKQIQQLSPKPQIDLSDTEAKYIIPDIIIEESPTGFSYYLHDHYLPSIKMNRTYTQLKNKNTAVQSYISERLTHLRWLQTSIAKRRETIIKIVEYILQTQTAFFKQGMSALKPLTLQDVANEIGMHESTVSRATANKKIQTPLGTFDFKSLFSSKVDTLDGTTISQQKMKTLLLQLIQTENKQKPLSDQKLAKYFTEEKGIVISRRTISKYRQELHIPSSRMRREI